MCDQVLQLLMSRHSDKKIIPLTPQELIDKRIKDLNIEIKQSRGKLDEYINVINNKIGNVIHSQMNKLVVVHKQIIDEKDQEIRNLQESTEKFKETVMSKHIKQLQETLSECKEDIDRITKVLEVFKKQSQKYKIQLDIKDKELQACKKREKKLLKQVWVLQENIKDIYSYQFVARQGKESQVIDKSHQRTSSYFREKTQQNSTKAIKNRKIHYRPLYTEQVTKSNDSRMNIQTDQQHSVMSRPSIYDGTGLYQKLNASSKRYDQSRSLRSNSQIRSSSKLLLSHRIPNYNIYDDLRHNIRKVDRITIEQPKYMEDKDKLIGKQEFQLIALNAPKIMKLIEKLVIEKYGELKQLDEYSIGLLNRLFQNENAVKILQIMLFTYSIQALHEIREQKQGLKHQNYYSQPTYQQDKEDQTYAMGFPKHQQVESAIRKNFKNHYHKPIAIKNVKHKAK